MIGEVIGWKTNHHPGIKTREDKITAWPDDAPFPRPDDVTLAQWAQEYEARAKPQPIPDAKGNSATALRDELNVVIKELRRKGFLESP